jgi:hypothetical protein
MASAPDLSMSTLNLIPLIPGAYRCFFPLPTPDTHLPSLNGQYLEAPTLQPTPEGLVWAPQLPGMTIPWVYGTTATHDQAPQPNSRALATAPAPGRLLSSLASGPASATTAHRIARPVMASAPTSTGDAPEPRTEKTPPQSGTHPAKG